MHKTSLNRNQSGIVSFFVVIIIMVVLTLIVLAFSQLVRREQRQTLDRQLQTQALYAAESGINDARDWLENEYDGSQTWNNDECDSFINTASLDPKLDGMNGVTSYSCLFVDPTPAILNYQISPEDGSAALQLNPDSQPINRMRIRWSNPNGGNMSCNRAVADFPPAGNLPNCDLATVRIEIVNFSGVGRSRNQLTNEGFIVYATPGNPTGNIVWGNNTGRQQGRPVGSSCNTSTRQCTINITGIPNIRLGYMRLTAIYDQAEVTVEPLNGGTSLSMIGAQYAIDATGRSNDVLHRLRANVPIVRAGNGPAPEFVVQTRHTLCKRFNVVDDEVTIGPLPSGSGIGDFCDPRDP